LAFVSVSTRDSEIEVFSRSRKKYRYSRYLKSIHQIGAVNSFGEQGPLGRVDKRDSHRRVSVIQAGICDGDQLGTRPDVGRGMGVL
jgi:hypothetical protein